MVEKEAKNRCDWKMRYSMKSKLVIVLLLVCESVGGEYLPARSSSPPGVPVFPSLAPLDESKDATRPSVKIHLSHQSTSPVDSIWHRREPRYASVPRYMRREQPVTQSYFYGEGSCVPYILDHHAILLARTGTIWFNNNSEVDLKFGKLIVITQKDALHVKTRHGALSIAANTLVIVHLNRKDNLKIANVNGNELTWICKNGNAKHSIAEGEELCLVDDAQGGFVEVSSVLSQPKDSEVVVVHRKIDTATVFETEIYNACDSGKNNVVRKKLNCLRHRIFRNQKPF